MWLWFDLLGAGKPFQLHFNSLNCVLHFFSLFGSILITKLPEEVKLYVRVEKQTQLTFQQERVKKLSFSILFEEQNGQKKLQHPRSIIFNQLLIFSTHVYPQFIFSMMLMF